MRLSYLSNKYMGVILARLIELVDEDLIREICLSAIHRLEVSITETKNTIDDMVLLPILKILVTILDEEDKV